MKTAKGISRIQIAKAWGTSPQYVSKVRRQCRDSGSDLPAFRTQRDAREWYEARRQRSGSDGYGSGSPREAVEPDRDSASIASPLDMERLLSEIQVEDFDAEMVRHAEQVPLAAHNLYLQAVAEKKDSLVSIRIKNWGEAAKQAALVREKFLTIQEKSGQLLPLDVVMDVYNTQVYALVSALDAIGRKYAKRANPEDPELARRILEEAADDIKRRVNESRARLEGEIIGRKEAVEAKTREVQSA